MRKFFVRFWKLTWRSLFLDLNRENSVQSLVHNAIAEIINQSFSLPDFESRMHGLFLGLCKACVCTHVSVFDSVMVCRHSSWPSETHFCWKAARERPYTFWLQHPEGLHSALSFEAARRNANVGRDPHWRGHHIGSWELGYHWHCQEQDSRKARWVCLAIEYITTTVRSWCCHLIWQFSSSGEIS